MKRFLPLVVVLGGALSTCLACAGSLTDSQPALGAAKPCTTVCGILADGLSGAQCERLKLGESRAVEFLLREVPAYPSRVEACAALHGWKLFVVRRDSVRDETCIEGGWNSESGCVYGLTQFGKVREILLGDDLFLTNSLTHELAHVLDHSVGWDVGPGDQHCAWGARGVKAAILEATGREDDTKEVCGDSPNLDSKKHK